MAAIDIFQFPCRSDNFGVLVHRGDTTISIDAPEESQILAALDEKGWTLTHILTTHHHGDHVEANAALKARFGVTIIGPEREKAKIPGIDLAVSGGETLDVGGIRVEVIDTPGHTLGEISYFMPDARTVFAADALFSLGCGRLFEGDAAMMWESLQRLRELPDDTMLYCGHEYTATNARCAIAIDPGNLSLQERVREVETLRVEGKATIPVRLGDEKRANPFLRADVAELKEAMGMADADPADVFAAIRKKRDQY